EHLVLGRLHVVEEAGEVDDAGHVGVAELDAASGAERGGHGKRSGDGSFTARSLPAGVLGGLPVGVLNSGSPEWACRRAPPARAGRCRTPACPDRSPGIDRWWRRCRWCWPDDP